MTKPYEDMTLEEFSEAVTISRIDPYRWAISSKTKFTESYFCDGVRTNTLHKYPVTVGIRFEPTAEAALEEMHRIIKHNARIKQ